MRSTCLTTRWRSLRLGEPRKCEGITTSFQVARLPKGLCHFEENPDAVNRLHPGAKPLNQGVKH
jgi:hypothetical protein